MRTALMLLFLLALAAIPGSLLPQRPLSPSSVGQYFVDHPQLAPILDRLALFDVFAAPWFAAIYLLLFVSLIGCLLPRAWGHLRSLRADPPNAPARLSRLPRHAEIATDQPVEQALTIAEQELRAARYRVVRRGEALSAERGRAKETGNVIFHLALVGVLVSLAVGKLWGYEGSILVQEGQGFCNAFQNYDVYTAGPMVNSAGIAPLCVTLNDFRVQFEPDLTPARFMADITYTESLGGSEADVTLGINSPLRADGARLYVTGRGFAPMFSVRLPNGQEFTDLSAPFLPQDTATFGSQGVLKLPDLGPDRAQLAIAGFFAPTAVELGGVLTSADPRPLDPAVAIVVYEGSLGLDSGIPQSVFTLDQARIDRGQLTEIGAGTLRPGEALDLPDGTSVTFTGFKEFAALQMSRDPAQLSILLSSVALLGGLLLTLLVRRRRVFIRAVRSTVGQPSAGLDIGGLAKGGNTDSTEFSQLVARIRVALADRRDT